MGFNLSKNNLVNIFDLNSISFSNDSKNGKLLVGNNDSFLISSKLLKSEVGFNISFNNDFKQNGSFISFRISPELNFSSKNFDFIIKGELVSYNFFEDCSYETIVGVDSCYFGSDFDINVNYLFFNLDCINSFDCLRLRIIDGPKQNFVLNFNIQDVYFNKEQLINKVLLLTK